jgi:hypothetical protein
MAPSAQASTSPILLRRYWDRPTPREYGDPDSKPIYRAVGYALTQWEDADQALLGLFRELNNTRRSIESRYVLSRAYDAIESHRGQRLVLAATADAYFSQYGESNALRQFLADIINAAEWAADRRDDIAHGIAWESISVDGHDFGSFLMSPEYKSGPARPAMPDADDPLGFARASYRYASTDIATFAAKFNDLRDAVWTCKQKIYRARPVPTD